MAAGETENELVVGAGMRLDGKEHRALGCGRMDGGETLGVEPIEGAEADDGVERPELGEFRETIVIEFDELSVCRRDEPGPLGLERRRDRRPQ